MNIYINGVPVDLIRSVEEGAIILRGQSGQDMKAIQKEFPVDQTFTFKGRYKDPLTFVLEPVRTKEEPEQQALAAASDADLRTIAAELGVDWDPKASISTMKKRIAAAQK